MATPALLVLALGLWAGLGSAGRVRAATMVEVTGSVWDSGSQKLRTFDKPDPYSASNSVSGSNGQVRADAYVFEGIAPVPSPEHPSTHIDLHADAFATSTHDLDPEVGPPEAFATARFTDRLQLNDLDVTFHDGLRLRFNPQLHGALSGGATVSFNVTLGGESKVLTGPGGLTFDRVGYPAGNGIDFGDLSLDMTLTAIAGANHPDETSESDFSHTAELGPILVTDVNGNPLANPPNLQIVGLDSGLTYEVVFPEPSAVGLGLIVGCIALARRHQRAR